MTPLEQINAIAGLCMKNATGWPNVLNKLGYIVERIELKFTIVDNSGKSRTVNPDIVLASDKKNSSLFFEAKSGDIQSDCEEQLERYSLVTREDVIQKAAIYSSRPGSHLFKMILFCNAKYQNSYKRIISAKSFPVAVIAISGKEIKLVLNSIKEKFANEIFRQGINIKNKYPPLSLIPILPDANHVQMTEHVVEAIIILLVKKKRHFTTAQLMDNVFGSGLWQSFDTEAKNGLLGKAKRILKEMSNTEFEQHIVRRGGNAQNPEEWTLKNHPDSKKTRQFQALKKLKIEYISRLTKGDLYKEYNPKQESLLAALEDESSSG